MSKKLTNKETKKVAELIRLNIAEEEINKYSDQLDTVLDYLDIFDELVTDNVEIASQVTELTNVMRPDEPEESLSQQDAIKNSNQTGNGYIKVDRVL